MAFVYNIAQGRDKKISPAKGTETEFTGYTPLLIKTKNKPQVGDGNFLVSPSINWLFR